MIGDPIHLKGTSRPRPRHVLVGMLGERLAWFRRQSWERQAQIDAVRFIGVEELHDLLAAHFAGKIEGLAA